MTEKSAFKNHTDLVSSSSLVIVSKKKFYPYYFAEVFVSYLAPTAAFINSVVILFGRSIGKPSARDHTNEAKTPSARETPNSTV